MQLRSLTPDYIVSPQLSVEDIPAIAATGITTIICNRPDSEVGVEQQAAAIRAAAEAVGLRFEELPFDHKTLSAEHVARQRELVNGSEGPVLAYCRTGTRCSIVWALGQLDAMSVDEVLRIAAAAGYRLHGNRAMFEAYKQQLG